MAEKAVAIADRLFREVMAPLVIGGELRPGRPIGGKNAFALGPFTDTLDQELLAHVDLGRVRVARRLAPVDLLHLRRPAFGGSGGLEPPTAADWVLAAVLHDLVQCAHPDLRVRPSSRLLQIATMTAERVAAPESVGEALARHTWFSRALEITRTDTEVSFWVGKRTFLGQDPPSRLLAWPELRRVHIDKSPRPLLELPGAGGHVDAQTFGAGVAAWLKKTPLTDLATCVRGAPAFAWSQETLRLVSTRAGRTLALRAQDDLVTLDVEVALGRATKPLIAGRASQALAIVTALLGERTLAAAVERAERRMPLGEAPLAAGGTSQTQEEDAYVARAIGAYGATALLAANVGALRQDLASAVRGQLEPWTRTAPAQTAKALLGA